MEKAMQKLQTEKEERERTVNDYEMRFSDIEISYKFNREMTIGMIKQKKMMVSDDSIELNIVSSPTTT